MVLYPCKTCRFFARLTQQCQRFPPLVVREAGPPDVTVTAWPRVQENDGCGEHQPNQPR